MIKYPTGSVLGAFTIPNFPKLQFAKIKEMIDAINAFGTSLTTTTLAVTGNGTVGGSLGVTGSTSLTGPLFLNGTPQTLTGAGAVNLTTQTTLVVTTGANALTLAAGTVGQIKVITMKTDGGDATLTPTGLRGGSTITLNDVGDTVTLMYIDSAWIILSNFGCTVA